MFYKLIVVALAFSVVPTFAHDDQSHSHPTRVYDASQVEEHAFGREGDPKKITRVIKINMDDAFRFSPDTFTIKRGETIKFVVSNSGKILHEMILGTPAALKEHAKMMAKFPNMEHADANMVHVKPGEHGEMIWQFTKPGEFHFACLVPGHFEAGMIGKLIVQ